LALPEGACGFSGLRLGCSYWIEGLRAFRRLLFVRTGGFYLCGGIGGLLSGLAGIRYLQLFLHCRKALRYSGLRLGM